MIDFLLSPDVAVFSTAAGLFFVLAMLEVGAMLIGAAGSMFTVDADIDLDLDAGGIAHPLEWLGVGRVPLAILMSTFLFLFGFAGLLAQTLADSALGNPLPWWLAAPAVLVGSVFGTRVIGRAIARVMPRDTSFVTSYREVIGHEVVITIGNAKVGHPAEAKWTDRFGKTNYLMVEPAEEGVVIHAGDRAIVLELDNKKARVMPSPALPPPQ